MGDGVLMVVRALGVREGSEGGGGTDSLDAKGAGVASSGNFRIWSAILSCVG